MTLHSLSRKQSRVCAAPPTSVVLAWLLSLVALVMPASPPARSAELANIDPVPEYNVKAAYLLLFARYVQWPDTAFVNASSPIIIVVVGNDPFGVVLDDTLRDQRIGSRPVRLVRVNRLTSELNAHVVFLAAASAREEQAWLEILHDRPILSVSDAVEYVGANVQLIEENGRIRFDVDRVGAERTKLKIASPMLVSARHIRGAASTRNGEQP